MVQSIFEKVDCAVVSAAGQAAATAAATVAVSAVATVAVAAVASVVAPAAALLGRNSTDCMRDSATWSVDRLAHWAYHSAL